ncbi:MAG: hypothetical protein J5843_00065 [Clostridia bacterium]|nr:hypothetical protein [Clostridia bacterium]
MSASRKASWARRQAYLYFGLAAFTGLFSGIYELFSHDVISFWMVLAFLPFLIVGFLWLLFTGLGLFRLPHRPFQICLMMATVSAVLGMVVRGILIIYGTWNNLVHSYDVLFGLFLAGAIVSFILYVRARNRRARKAAGDPGTGL